MSETYRREWRLYIEDMMRFAERALSYTEGMNKAAFVASGITYDATLRNIELIGEAATKVPTEIREQYSNIPWRMIIGTRNQLIHGYLGIDNDIVWSVICDELPGLIQELSLILDSN